MRAVPAASRFFLLVLVLSTALTAGNIVSSSGTIPSFPSINANQFLAASWTVSQSYTGVAISATFGGGSPVGASPGVAYLTTSVGPAAATLASAPFIFPVGYTATDLFTGLNLSPGVYFLVLAAPTGLGGAWQGGSPPSVTSDYGESVVGYYFTFAGGINAADPPASLLWLPNPDMGLAFTVTGTPADAEVPEPGTLALAGFALAAFALAARKR